MLKKDNCTIKILDEVIDEVNDEVIFKWFFRFLYSLPLKMKI